MKKFKVIKKKPTKPGDCQHEGTFFVKFSTIFRIFHSYPIRNSELLEILIRTHLLIMSFIFIADRWIQFIKWHNFYTQILTDFPVELKNTRKN